MSFIRLFTAGTCVSVGFLSPSAAAQDFESMITTNASTTTIDTAITLDTTGTLIGDYDSKTNPSGTQTRPGFFGGSGNQAMNTSMAISADTALATNPAGSFVISPDFDLNLVEMNGLTIDLLNGQSGGTSLSISMLYDTFHTVNPSFVYPGGVPITLPLGVVAGITQAAVTQTDAGAGTLTPTANPSVFDLAVLIPSQLDMVLDTSLPGQDPTTTPIEALPIVLPAAGTLEVLTDGTLLISLVLSPDPIVLDIPLTGAVLPDIPLELPTFGTETAGVIFASVPSMVSVDASIGMTILATGTKAATCPADLNGDGVLNFFDVSAFLNAFGAMEPVADFNGDGMFNFFDVSAFLNSFGAGCP